MKRKGLSLFLVMCIILSTFMTLPITASAAESGKCGDNVYWTFYDNGTLTISGEGSMSVSSSSTIPWENWRDKIKKVIVENGVTRIGNFENCTNLTSVELSDTIRTIADYAFSHCSNLRKINLPSSLKYIRWGAFSGCESLVKIDIPDTVKHIEKYTFCGCKNLKYVKLPKYLVSIDDAAFGECESLEKIDIPDTVDTIEILAFSGCDSLRSVTVPEGVIELEGVFAHCANLKNVRLPNSLEVISCTFVDCPGLLSISVPNGVQELKATAFADCVNLKCISIPTTVELIENRVFEGCTGLTDVFYAGSKEEWNNIKVVHGSGNYTNTILKNVRMHFNCVGIDWSLVGYNSASTSNDAPSILSAYITYGGKSYDMFSQSVCIEKDSETEVEIKANVDANGCKDVKISLTQGLDEAIELTDGVYKKMKPGKELSEGEIYLLAVDMDTGKSTALKTKLNISKTKDGELFNGSGPDGFNFTLGKKVGFTIPEPVPIFGGTDINWDFGFIPISVEYDRNDNNKINVVFGANLACEEEKDKDGKVTTKYFKDFKFEEYKKAIKKYKEDIKEGSGKLKKTFSQLMNDYKSNDKKFGLFGDKIFGGGKGSIDPTVDIAGYGELKYINGKWILAEGQFCVEAEIKLEYQGQIFIWVVPCYYEVGGGIGAGFEGDMISINPAGFKPIFDAYITAKIMAEIGLGVGIAKAATLGATGEGSLNLKQALNKDYFKAWGEGEASFEIKVLGKTVAQKSFAKGEFLIYETGSSEGLIKDDAISIKKVNEYHMLNNVKSSEIYPNESRSYAESPTVWQPQSRKMLKSAGVDYSNKNLKKLASNIYPETKPMICDINGTKVMVMQWDNAQRADIDRTMLVYSVYDENTASWSEPTAVDDDGTADFYPCFKDGYLVWQNSKTLLSDDMTLEDIAKKGEICIAKWNGSGFDKTNVTDNETLDTLPYVCADGNTVNVTWVTNSNNDILGITGRNTIMQKTYTDGVWGEASAVKTDLNAVISLSSGYADNKYSIAYIEDGDNDFNTMNDRNIVVISNGNEINITDDDALNSNPVFLDNRIYYYSDGNIISANIDGSDKQSIFKEAKAGLTDNFVIDINSNGDKAVWWTKAQSGAAEVYSALYKDNKWSNEISVTSLGNTAKYPTGILNDDGTMLIAFTDGITENNEITQTDLYTISVTPSYDLELTDAYMDEETATVHAKVKNSGELMVNSYTVSLDDNGTNNLLTVTEPLSAGDTKEIEIKYNKPSDFTKRTITANVSANDIEEYNLANNSAEISVGLADISIVSVDSYEKLPNSSVVAVVKNEGDCAAENVILSLRKETENGEVIDEANIGTLSAGEVKSITLEYEPIKYDNVLWYVTVQTSSDEISAVNNIKYFVNECAVDLAETEHTILNYNINDKTLSVNTFVKNNTENSLSGNVYVAVYNVKNELVGVTLQPINVPSYSDTGVDLWINNYIKAPGDYIKAFLWGENQTPKCDIDIRNIQ